MDEYIKFFMIVLVLIIVSVILYQYDSFTSIIIAFILLVSDAFAIIYYT